VMMSSAGLFSVRAILLFSGYRQPVTGTDGGKHFGGGFGRRLFQ